MYKFAGKILAIMLCLALLALNPGILERLFTFFFIGIIPFTSISLPIGAVLLIDLIVFIVLCITATNIVKTLFDPVKRDLKKRSHARKVVLARSHPYAPQADPSRPKKRFLPIAEL